MRTSALLFALSVVGCSGETRVDLLEPELMTDAGSRPQHLVHRFSFSGAGSRVHDSLGGPDGILENGAALDGAGHAVLDGKDDYVDLPNGLLSSLPSATVIAWLSWNGGPCWQRVFDFGSSDAGEGEAGNATSSVFATPLRCPGTGPATSYQGLDGGAGSVDSDEQFPILRNTSIAVVMNGSDATLSLYVAGKALGAGRFGASSELSDSNVWLGRSQWVQDAALRGSFDELRVYDAALTAEELSVIDTAGPDEVPSE